LINLLLTGIIFGNMNAVRSEVQCDTPKQRLTIQVSGPKIHQNTATNDLFVDIHRGP